MSTVDEYLKNVAAPQLAEYERIRKIVKQVAPEAEEAISYGMPAFKYQGNGVLYFGVFKDHMSIFPGAPVELKDKLEGYKLSKGTIQFTLDKPLPEALIKEILQNRLAAISEKLS